MSNLKDLTGQVFDRITVVSRAGRTKLGQATWNCICSCGNARVVPGQSLRSGATTSCGCRILEQHKAAAITLEERKQRRSSKAKIKDKTPIRRLQKNIAQMKYAVSDKAILSAFHRWVKKRKNKLEITDEELLIFRNRPCHSCGKTIEGAGNSFLLIKPRGSISIPNMIPTCGICKLIKPKEAFDPITFAKALLRRFWKKTPMASITKQRARKGRGQYECFKCKNLFSEKFTQMDHIDPVVSVEEGFKDLDTFAKRLFCSDTNLQILCLSCHSQKTALENEQRQKAKK